MYGWIKLHRKSLESAVWRKEKLWKVWTYCLLRANHKEATIMWNGNQRRIQAGQFIVGRFEGAKDCQMKPTTFYFQLKKLKTMGNLDIISDNKNSLVTIVNWSRYQVSADHSDSKSNTSLTPACHRQEEKKENNVFIDSLVSFLNENNIGFDEATLRARMGKAFQRYSKSDIQRAVNDAIEPWLSNGHSGDFVRYLFVTLGNNYPEIAPAYGKPDDPLAGID